MIDSIDDKTLKLYEIEIDAIRQELKKLPTGCLVRQGIYYYLKEGSVQKGITKDQTKIMQLARKAYLLRRLKHLELNCELKRKQSGCYKTEDSIKIIQSLSSSYRMLPKSYFFHPSVHEQIKTATVGNLAHPDELIYMTDSGITVRSKSERTIANALSQYGIPYQYEAALALGGINKHPDFTIARPFDGKLIIWEHFGLMDHDGYRQKAIEKLALYSKYGFFPFENLICTFEKDLRNIARVNQIIEMFVLL